MINCIDVVDVENETDLLCLIGLGAFYDENQIGHRCDIHVCFTPKTKLSYPD